jgi:hypothetical protein
MVSSGAPESSSWPAGSSVTEAPSLAARSACRSPRPAPAEAGQAASAALRCRGRLPGQRAQVIEAEAELLVLGADAPDAIPGGIDIEFVHAGKVVATHPWRLDAREPGSARRRGFDARDAIYLVTPDRFANGDPSNDSVTGMLEAANRANPNGRHGGDIAGMRQHIDYIAGMGFTQLWPTPFLENDQPQYSYHGYAITDLYKTDPRMGRNEDVRALSREARAKGVGLIMDIVLNHIGSKHWWMTDLPAKDWINHGGTFAPTNHRRTTIQDPHAAPADREAFTDGWFVDAMPDLNQRNPHLARYLIQNTCGGSSTPGCPASARTPSATRTRSSWAIGRRRCWPSTRTSRWSARNGASTRSSSRIGSAASRTPAAMSRTCRA